MSYKSKYRDWLLNDYFDEETKEELESIQDNEQEIEDRFYKNLEFGTGGMRGKMGAGTNRMNKYIVRKATQGLANYIINYSEDGKENGVVIAYDSRHKSREFAEETALVLAGNGIKAYLFSELRPTPELSFAVRELNAEAGVVVTASHNPPEYNGYKVYGSDGCQLVPDKARKVIAEINELDDFSLIKRMDKSEAEEEGLFKILGSDMDEKYQEAVIDVLPDVELANKAGNNLKIIYTPLHGTGNKPVRDILSTLGFKEMMVVQRQAEPDPDFSTVTSPNPEDRDAYTLALELAESYNPDLIMATDPDADRLGALVKDGEGYTALNGNEIGVLMADYLLSRKKEENLLPDNPVIIKTIVSTEMIRPIADKYNTIVKDVLTGFKYIGEEIKKMETTDEEFILGFEESFGYLTGTYVRDKDAVNAAALLAMMALYYQEEREINLLQRLSELREEHGFFLEDLESMRLEGKEGQEEIERIIASLREECPAEIAGEDLVVFKDYLSRISRDLKSGEEREINLPESNVLQFILADESKITIRPSGTEPKLKFYFAVRANSEENAKSRLENLKEKFLVMIDKV
ncbi:phospho-sugar mutase [Halanaerobiaceae bacterium Z-7014]|uniref:Phosphoglucomutase n=1 Tax=Halonatronomonas betaini TaxID=2778430 RepID=A0A931F9P5_9FIRM|nr:phospho-sugar mutase [Halonatronomonas betaini]MBF8437803.1 phospho-sugar mutase [Halonatronomonas betaini]